jgi:CDP-diacylglycerol--glycerol-3-phosphate 3-phosphatidyltransferase
MVPMWLVLIVLIRELFITGLRTVAAGEGMIIAASRGGKLKTMFALTGMAALLVHHTYVVDFFVFKLPVSFHVLGLVLTYISLFFCITSALEYTYRVVKALTAKQKTVAESNNEGALNGAG